jgi:hypothetical protein
MDFPSISEIPEPFDYLSFGLEFLFMESSRTSSNVDESVKLSGLRYSLKMQRDPYFYLIYYVIPQIFFVFVAYCAFWVNHAAVPARVALSITTILITIKFSNGIYVILPPVKYEVWLVTFSTGVLVFACISMIEYAFVNYSNFHYNVYKTQINDCMTKFRKEVPKLKQKFEKEKVESHKFEQD